MTDCTYCGCTVEAHDPVFVYEERENGGEREDEDEWEGEAEWEDESEQVAAGQFCNYACLSARIEESNLADGATCRLDA